MANQIVTLKDDNNNPTFPIAGGMAEDSITTQMLKDGSITSDKIDWTTSSIPISIGPKSTTAQVIYLGDGITLVCGHYTLTSYTTSDSATNVKITGLPDMSSIFSCAVQAMQIGQSASYTSYPHLYSSGNGFDFYIRNSAANASAAIEVSFHVLGIPSTS